MLKVDYKKVQGCNRPEEIDTLSSKGYVYLRKDISEVETENGTMYEYNEAYLTEAEYKEYLAEQENPMLSIIMQKQNELQLQIYQLMAQMGGN